MKIAFYPGSFNPWHEGHQDILEQSLKVFDKVVILQLTNPNKVGYEKLKFRHIVDGIPLKKDGKIEIISRHGATLFAVAGTYILGRLPNEYAVIRGMRNEKDFCEEQILKYVYQDMGIKMPIFHIIARRDLVHISSSMLTAMNQFKEGGLGTDHSSGE